MTVFDKKYAKKLRQTGNYNMLFDYCSSFPDDAAALSYLAMCYHNGYGTSKDREMAFLYDYKSYELGCADGEAGLALDYLYGYGTSKDEDEGMKLLHEAINEESVIALRYLGYCYEDGVGVEKDETEAVEWYRKAADAGDAVAMRHLGACYEDGVGVEIDDARAVEWYDKAAEAGDAIAMRCLGVCYENGTGVKKDEVKAVEWYHKAADAKDAIAMRFLGINYENGIGVENDETKAIEWYRKAADAGDTVAMRGLGKCYENGSLGVEKNGAQAIEWYRRAMDSGDEMAELNIGIIYFDGKIIEKNAKKAAEIFEKIYITTKDSQSAYYLARCYLTGEGASLNLKKAFELINIAANQGHILSNIYLVYLYLRGIGTKRNYKKATRLIHLLESNEEYENYYDYINLYEGIICYHGLGIKKDISKAKELFDKAPGVGSVLYSPLCDGNFSKADFLGSVIYNDKRIATEFLLYPDKSFSKELLTNAYNNKCLSARGYQVLSQILSEYRKSKKARKVMYEKLCNDVIENNNDSVLLCDIGRCYFYGYGVKRNYSEAVNCFLKSSSLGNSYAKAYLSYCYYNGLGVEKNDKKAIEVLGIDAEKRGDHANILLGLLTYAGMCGIEKDKEKGIELVKTGSQNRTMYAWYVEYLSSQRGDSYVPFLLQFFFNRLHFSFDPSVKFKIQLSAFLKLLLLLIFRNPSSTNLSKKELYRMILEYKSDYDNKLDILIQHQEPILNEVKRISTQTEQLAEISHKVAEIDEKIGTLILSLQEEIDNGKRSFVDQLENNESQYMRFVDLIATRMCDTLYQSGNASVEFEESTLRGLFGKYWDVLDGFTKKALVSAKVFLANCSSITYSGLDYSGVCISTCSALEQELKLRFFTGYQEYLRLRFKDDYTKWPKSMKYHQSDGSYTENTIFTIGSLPAIFGSKQRNEETGKRSYNSKMRISDEEKQLLNEYIKTITNITGKDIEAFFEGSDSETSFLDRCEDVRCIYRNAAAHTKSLSLETATACCKEIIGVDGENAAKTVGQVQGLIYDLARLTRLPKSQF